MTVDHYFSPELADDLFDMVRLAGKEGETTDYVKDVMKKFDVREKEAREKTIEQGAKYYAKDFVTFGDTRSVDISLTPQEKKLRYMMEEIVLGYAFKRNKDQVAVRDNWLARASYSVLMKRVVDETPLRFMLAEGQNVEARGIAQQMIDNLPKMSTEYGFYKDMLDFSEKVVTDNEAIQNKMITPVMADIAAKRQGILDDDKLKLIGIMPGTLQVKEFKKRTERIKTRIAVSPQDHLSLDSSYLASLGFDGKLPASDSFDIKSTAKILIHDTPLELLTTPVSSLKKRLDDYSSFARRASPTCTKIR